MNPKNEDCLLPGTNPSVRAVDFRVGGYSPTEAAAWAFRARSAPEDRKSALVARVSRKLPRLASTSTEITPTPQISFAYV